MAYAEGACGGDGDDSPFSSLLSGLPATPPGYYREAIGRQHVLYRPPQCARVAPHCFHLDTVAAEHPLWSGYVWNASRALADALCAAPEWVRGRTVCELGAGAGLVSVVAARACGAALVVATDYPDEEVMRALRGNAGRNGPSDEDVYSQAPVERSCCTGNIHVLPYRWGDDATAVRACLPHPAAGFDVLLLADVISYHSAHTALADSVAWLLRRHEDAVALLAFSHHRPHVRQRDEDFFRMICQRHGLLAREWHAPVDMLPMFPDDPGEAVIRGRVHFMQLQWPRDGRNRECNSIPSCTRQDFT
ncbi:hypothetical protein CDCA_CDCA07G2035 [Cyanidium caldarium]|uniref:Uncharacterized protein n=1 Tax=Cyanidium caldarium TaxID=2771 RepID=A0AAV9IV91_CYACA|nr:hypothetical protein CDCA_CDCA07G2035 [Cyanidium caldarium]|eukprot:ctg_820.g185